MTKNTFLQAGNKKITFLLFAILFSAAGFSQTDTLHLYYDGLKFKLEDSTEKKIGEWVKKLNAKPVDVDIVAYYFQGDFKKYSAARLEDVSIVITRKARDFTTIKSSDTKKGQKSQRSTVDIIYRPAGTVAIKQAPVKKEAEKKETVKKETVSTTSTQKKETSEVKTEEKAVETTEEPTSTNTNMLQPTVKDGYYMDSVYVNGVLKVTKRKIKKK